MTVRSPLSNIVIAFLAGFLATIIFHQIAVVVLNAFGGLPGNFTPWSMDPVAPFGVPTIISKAFWGGLWAILLSFVLKGRLGNAYWVSWTLAGAIALPLVAIFIVPPLKGAPIPDFAELMPPYAFVNAAWGFGTALFMRVFGRGG